MTRFFSLVALLAFTVSPAFSDDAKPGSAAKNLLKPTNQVDSWRFEQHENATGGIRADGDAIVFEVKNLSGTDWHLQAVQTDLDLKEGVEYDLKFEIKADTRRSITVSAGIDEEDWHQIGLYEELYLGPEFKKMEFSFRAESVHTGKKNRISFVVGGDRGNVSLKNVTLTEKKR